LQGGAGTAIRANNQIIDYRTYNFSIGAGGAAASTPTAGEVRGSGWNRPAGDGGTTVADGLCNIVNATGGIGGRYQYGSKTHGATYPNNLIDGTGGSNQGNGYAGSAATQTWSGSPLGRITGGYGGGSISAANATTGGAGITIDETSAIAGVPLAYGGGAYYQASSTLSGGGAGSGGGPAGAGTGGSGLGYSGKTGLIHINMKAK
jgi:hypothetical protein